MRARGTAGAAILAAILAARAGRADPAVDFKPTGIVGGGYDDNLLFNNTGGDEVGRVGLRVDLKAWEHLTTFTLNAGVWAYGFLHREQIVPLGESTMNLDSEVSHWDTVLARVKVRGSDDPLGLAQLGVLNAQGTVIGYKSYAEEEHAFDERTSLAALVTFEGVGFLTAPYTSQSGESAGAGVEPRYRVTRDLTLEFRVDGRAFYSQGFDGAAADARPGARYRITRNLYVEADAGTSIFLDGPLTTPLFITHGTVEYADHQWAARVTGSQDLAIPTGHSGVLVLDLIEGLASYGDNRWEVRVRGGYYRTLSSPTSSIWNPGVGADLDAFVKLGSFTWVGVSAERFQQIGTPYQQSVARDAIYAQIELTEARP
jgi:hypothetical protein